MRAYPYHLSSWFTFFFESNPTSLWNGNCVWITHRAIQVVNTRWRICLFATQDAIRHVIARCRTSWEIYKLAWAVNVATCLLLAFIDTSHICRIAVSCSRMGTVRLYASSALFVWLVIKLMRVGKRESFLPKGPPTVPLLGNLNIFPKFEAHLKYALRITIFDL